MGTVRSQIASLAFAVACSAGLSAHADDTKPYVIPQSVFVTASQRSLAKAGADDKTGHWIPKIQFDVHGPLAAGTVLTVDFTLPGGKPWFSMPWDTLKSDLAPESVMPYDAYDGGDTFTPHAQTATGEFGFKISTKFDNVTTTLFTGHFTVAKAKSDPAIKAGPYKDKVDYWVDQDWALPLGYVATTWHRFSGDVDHHLRAWVWLKGPHSGEYDSNCQATLLYNGKKLDGEVAFADGVLNIATPSTATQANSWQRAGMVFNFVVPKARRDGNPTDFVLEKNPGEYEIQVTYLGKLARSLHFTVGADGKIADPLNTASSSGWNGFTLVPAKVIGDADGKSNRAAWKKGMYYGNPVEGFAVE